MTDIDKDQGKIVKLFEIIHKVAQLITFLITIMAALSLFVSSLGLFFYLNNPYAMSLYSKAIASIPLLTVLGFFSFGLAVFTVGYAIIPAILTVSNQRDVGKSTVDEVDRGRLEQKDRTASNSFLNLLLRFFNFRIFSIYRRFVNKIYNWIEMQKINKDFDLSIVFWIGLIYLIGYQPLVVFVSNDFSFNGVDLKIPVVFLNGLCLVISFLFLRGEEFRFKKIIHNYFGILLLAVTMTLSCISPSDTSLIVFLLGIIFSVICSCALKLRYSDFVSRAVQETFVLYAPLIVVIFILLDILPMVNANNSNAVAKLVWVVGVVTFCVFISNCLVEYALGGKEKSGYEKIKSFLWVIALIISMAMICSPVVVRNSLFITRIGNYEKQVHGKNVNIIIKLDGDEYFISGKNIEKIEQ